MKQTREFVKRVYDVYEETQSMVATAQELGISPGVVRYWISNPGRFDPYLDEIAIERALLGERKVFKNLTCWEEEVVYQKVQEILENQEDHLLAGKVYALYSNAWGIPDETLRQRLFRRVRSRTAA